MPACPEDQSLSLNFGTFTLSQDRLSRNADARAEPESPSGVLKKTLQSKVAGRREVRSTVE